MIGYRKKSYIKIYSLLASLQKDSSNFEALKTIQILLISEIVRAEKKIRFLKSQLNAIKHNEKKYNSILKRIEGYRNLVFIWRCFGDAIAFTYLDKHALKHTFFSTERYKPMNESGFILDKEGLPHEFSVVIAAIEHNVPALLSDLTNTIRHGDVCLMGGNDPYLIEVKASETRNERARKQKKRIETLHSFYETDQSSRLRGMPHVVREAYNLPEIKYAKELDNCITEALTSGMSKCKPEFGLQYIAIRTKDAKLENIFDSTPVSSGIVFMWNQERIERSWPPYYPFILSIKSEQNLWAFIKGEVYIIVLFDTKSFDKIARDLGYTIEYRKEDIDYPVQVNFKEGDGYMRISGQLIGRIGMECVSPEWLFTSSVENFKSASNKSVSK